MISSNTTTIIIIILPRFAKRPVYLATLKWRTRNYNFSIQKSALYYLLLPNMLKLVFSHFSVIDKPSRTLLNGNRCTKAFCFWYSSCSSSRKNVGINIQTCDFSSHMIGAWENHQKTASVCIMHGHFLKISLRNMSPIDKDMRIIFLLLSRKWFKKVT